MNSIVPCCKDPCTCAYSVAAPLNAAQALTTAKINQAYKQDLLAQAQSVHEAKRLERQRQLEEGK